MVRTMLVIRKIVDRTSYNRANIIDPIPAYPRHHSLPFTSSFSPLSVRSHSFIRLFLFLRYGG